MHPEAFQYVRRFRTNEPISVIEIGSRDINGTARPFFPMAQWTGIDLHPGPCVDVVGDAELYIPSELVNLVVCCEVFEHAANWRQLVKSAFGWIKSGGIMVVTCAGPGRVEHSAIDGEHRLIDGEHYQNVSAVELADCFAGHGFVNVNCMEYGFDTYGNATKP